jgi:hydrogenase expression/formation protein HypE
MNPDVPATLEVGKIPPDLLTRLVYPHLGRRTDVLVHAHVGEDCAVLDYGETVCVLTSDPITAAGHHLGRLAVHVGCNDLATTGAEPIAVLLTLLLCEGSTPEALEAIMTEAGQTAASLGVEIAGGHTEVTPGIDRTIAIVTAVGKARKGAVITGGGAHPHDSVIVTKGAGIEGTAILASDLAGRLEASLGKDALARAQAFIDQLSVIPDGRVGGQSGATAMHDVTEGGVLAGVWELAEASGLGVVFRADAVPVLPETQAICHALDLDPLALIGSGALLICTPNPQAMLRALSAARIPAAEIGLMTEKDRVILRRGRSLPLIPPPRDEIYRALSQAAEEG